MCKLVRGNREHSLCLIYIVNIRYSMLRFTSSVYVSLKIDTVLNQHCLFMTYTYCNSVILT